MSASQIPKVTIVGPDGTTALSSNIVQVGGSVSTPPVTVGSQTNLWNAVAVAAGGISSSVTIHPARRWLIFGTTSGASTLTVRVSGNGVTFFDSSVNVAANGDFTIDCRALHGANFIQVKSSAAVTITAGVTGTA